MVGKGRSSTEYLLEAGGQEALQAWWQQAMTAPKCGEKPFEEQGLSETWALGTGEIARPDQNLPYIVSAYPCNDDAICFEPLKRNLVTGTVAAHPFGQLVLEMLSCPADLHKQALCSRHVRRIKL